ncbi:VCBS repeat-containing protein [Flagellimonas nanhaiensis]|uniref:RNA-binding protein n=1 Tax=Flagellimonas nanhaiensis TaxID=2292706 RepID=A0A371JUR4_9FLAO|nr:VCBS repeat-containing protein [Allomuricauda nanhaiensis]RDY61561.1 RNA-binding protein [Allomuricauda nanhaiensis]
MTLKRVCLFSVLLMTVFFGCEKSNETKNASSTPRFELLPASKTGIDFINKVKQTNTFNFLNYLDIFNGGGVALGDFNNDELLDIYFTSNQNSNKLYLNQGDFEFEDVTVRAGVSDELGWTTGVNVMDFNNDGHLDIYVCKSGALQDSNLRKNKLFINQGDATFKDEAEAWGIDHSGFSIQSYFVDYDKDGDLDMYLVNHRSDFNNVRKIDSKVNWAYIDEFSDQLFRNDDGFFTNVTEESGLRNKAWGLSAAIGDFNEDGWPDIYVANDFIQPDHIYINNQDGTFTDDVLGMFDHISYNSMGSDYADINNDLLPDLVVLDMLAEDHLRSKENMATMDSRGFQYMVESNYHYPYMSNVLQLNLGKGNFSEVAQLTGISKTDWSWGPLIADFDNDGYKDIFISNGIEKDLGNQDFRVNLRPTIQANPRMGIEELEQLMPGEKMANYIFQNKGELELENVSEHWGIDIPMNSNGAAYGDLDNDGDLDLVLNNSSDVASIFKNNSEEHNFIKLSLKGKQKNVDAIGAKVKIVTKNGHQLKTNYFARGYQSAMKDALHFGLGNVDKVQSIVVEWPDSTISTLQNQGINQILVVHQKNAMEPSRQNNNLVRKEYLKAIDKSALEIDFEHTEPIYDDFKNQVLLPQKLSQLGPDIEVGDVNNDELDDVIVSGAQGQSVVLFTQEKNGLFRKKKTPDFERHAEQETLGLHLFDCDGDGDLDLYATNGSYEFDENDPSLQDVLYKNDGLGNFSTTTTLPQMLIATKKVISIDYDNDGDLDLFVGGRLIGKKYPLPPKSYILENNSGVFTEATQRIAPELETVGMITDMVFSDYDKDGDKDLIVVGEWMPISVFENTGGHFSLLPIDGVKVSQGWWQSIEILDIDNDGDDDYLIGNLGKNNKFHPTAEKPLHVYASHLDDNESFDMILSKEYKGRLVPTRGKECSTQQNPFLDQKFKSYKAFANSSLQDIYGADILEKSYHAEAKTFHSSLLINNGNGNFELKSLPNAAQKGPTLDFEVVDLNKDGYLDVIGVGAIHETEVETIRYDGNSGYILLNNKGKLVPAPSKDFHLDENTKVIKKINLRGIPYLLVGNNNGPLQIFKTQSSIEIGVEEIN